jgi:hypothetical protein
MQVSILYKIPELEGLYTAVVDGSADWIHTEIDNLRDDGKEIVAVVNLKTGELE